MSDFHAFVTQLTQTSEALKEVMKHPLIKYSVQCTAISEVDWAVERILEAAKETYRIDLTPVADGSSPR